MSDRTKPQTLATLLARDFWESCVKQLTKAELDAWQAAWQAGVDEARARLTKKRPKQAVTELDALQAWMDERRARLTKGRPKTREWTINGIRYVSGTGPADGMLAFHPDGSVTAHPAEHAAFSEMLGNAAEAKATLPGGSRTPAFETAHHFQRLAEQGHNFPPDWRDPDAAMQLATIHTAAVWPLVLALAAGDSKPLRDLAAAVDVVNKVKSPWLKGEHCKALIAVERAAEEAEAPPTRRAAFEAWAAANGVPPKQRDAYRESFRQSLETLGFSWLAGKSGRPRKPGTE